MLTVSGALGFTGQVCFCGTSWWPRNIAVKWCTCMCVWVCCRVRLLTLWLHFTGARCRRIAFPATRTPYFCWSMFSCCWSFRTCSRCDVVCLRPSSDKLPALPATEFVESPSRIEMSLVIQSPTFSWCERAFFVARPIFCHILYDRWTVRLLLSAMWRNFLVADLLWTVHCV